MDLVSVVLFLILYYLRPQEWSPMFATIHFVQIVMLTGLGTLYFRDRGFRPKELFRTPHDWAVLAFWLWMVLSSQAPWEIFKENANLLIFYIVIVQALSTVPRMRIFLGWWTLLIVVVALLALATQWGFDPLDSLEKTMGPMKGRLILNLSIFNNPNGLGHSVVPAIPMLYYYLIWKRPMLSRIIGVALLLIPLYCIYQTVSKGAFLSAAIATVATMTFGRPKSVQIGIVVLAFLFGATALYSLPRMNELSHSKSDEAIQGRVAAFKHGYKLMQSSFRGVGKAHWGDEPFMTDYIRVAVSPKSGDNSDKGHFILKPVHYSKAPHSTYVCTGAELGKPGLFLFLGILYCCLRTTMSAKTKNAEEERIRRMLFVLVISFVVSSWMVDFEYRPTFFMFAAAIAAFHRHLLGMLEQKEEDAEELEMPTSVPVWHPTQFLPQPVLAGTLSDSTLAHHALPIEPSATSAPLPSESEPSGIAWNWNRIGLFDIAAVSVITWVFIRLWIYAIERM